MKAFELLFVLVLLSTRSVARGQDDVALFRRADSGRHGPNNHSPEIQTSSNSASSTYPPSPEPDLHMPLHLARRLFPRSSIPPGSVRLPSERVVLSSRTQESHREEQSQYGRHESRQSRPRPRRGSKPFRKLKNLAKSVFHPQKKKASRGGKEEEEMDPVQRRMLDRTRKGTNFDLFTPSMEEQFRQVHEIPSSEHSKASIITEPREPFTSLHSEEGRISDHSVKSFDSPRLDDLSESKVQGTRVTSEKLIEQKPTKGSNQAKEQDGSRSKTPPTILRKRAAHHRLLSKVKRSKIIDSSMGKMADKRSSSRKGEIANLERRGAFSPKYKAASWPRHATPLTLGSNKDHSHGLLRSDSSPAAIPGDQKNLKGPKLATELPISDNLIQQSLLSQISPEISLDQREQAHSLTSIFDYSPKPISFPKKESQVKDPGAFPAVISEKKKQPPDRPPSLPRPPSNEKKQTIPMDSLSRSQPQQDVQGTSRLSSVRDRHKEHKVAPPEPPLSWKARRLTVDLSRRHHELETSVLTSRFARPHDYNHKDGKWTSKIQGDSMPMTENERQNESKDMGYWGSWEQGPLKDLSRKGSEKSETSSSHSTEAVHTLQSARSSNDGHKVESLHPKDTRAQENHGEGSNGDREPFKTVKRDLGPHHLVRRDARASPILPSKNPRKWIPSFVRWCRKVAGCVRRPHADEGSIPTHREHSNRLFTQGSSIESHYNPNRSPQRERSSPLGGNYEPKINFEKQPTHSRRLILRGPQNYRAQKVTEPKDFLFGPQTIDSSETLTRKKSMTRSGTLDFALSESSGRYDDNSRAGTLGSHRSHGSNKPGPSNLHAQPAATSSHSGTQGSQNSGLLRQHSFPFQGGRPLRPGVFSPDDSVTYTPFSTHRASDFPLQGPRSTGEQPNPQLRSTISTPEMRPNPVFRSDPHGAQTVTPEDSPPQSVHLAKRELAPQQRLRRRMFCSGCIKLPWRKPARVAQHPETELIERAELGPNGAEVTASASAQKRKSTILEYEHVKESAQQQGFLVLGGPTMGSVPRERTVASTSPPKPPLYKKRGDKEG